MAIPVQRNTVIQEFRNRGSGRRHPPINRTLRANGAPKSCCSDFGTSQMPFAGLLLLKRQTAPKSRGSRDFPHLRRFRLRNIAVNDAVEHVERHARAIEDFLIGPPDVVVRIALAKSFPCPKSN